MVFLVLGLLLFLGTHSALILAPGLRGRVLARGGRAAWMLPYTIVSIVGVVLIVWGYGLARQDPAILYVPPAGLRHLALLLMLPVFPLLIAAYAPGHIKGVIRHPMLLAAIFWGTAHLFANGTVADLLLFGGFAGWAAADWYSSARRLPKFPTSQGPRFGADAIAVAGGLVIYGIFVGGLHQVLFGVSPI